MSSIVTVLLTILLSLITYYRIIAGEAPPPLPPLSSTAASGKNVDFTPICYEDLCGSIVTYCLLSDDCRCDVKQNVTCAHTCGRCLGYLFTSCCVCAKLCNPKPSNGIGSSFEYIKEPDPELFSLIVNQASEKETRWTSYTYSVDLVLFDEIHGDKPRKSSVNATKQPVVGDGTRNESVNCTVAFVNEATSLHKCSVTCNSMGASSFRFFGNGCCECVGQFCPNFGVDHPKCDFPYKDFAVPSIFVDETEYTEEMNS